MYILMAYVNDVINGYTYEDDDTCGLDSIMPNSHPRTLIMLITLNMMALMQKIAMKLIYKFLVVMTRTIKAITILSPIP